ncbi:MAG: DinB family protein [Bacteroidota bacterium]
MTNTDELTTTAETTGITSEALLQHWLGHRGLTRRTIEAFPEDKLFTYSIGGMRPFAELVYEFLGMAVPGITGVATGKWQQWADAKKVTTKKELLNLWDNATEDIHRIWPTIPAHRFHEKDIAFGQWPGTGISFIFYFIDNEIHHRGQGYVYLRSLGIEPPAFWDRPSF